MLEAADTNLGRRTPRRAALEPACSHGRTSNSRASPCQHLHRSGTARPIDAAAEAQSQPSAARAGVPRVPQWQATSQAHRRGHGCPSAPGDVAPWRRQHDRRPPPLAANPRVSSTRAAASPAPPDCRSRRQGATCVDDPARAFADAARHRVLRCHPSGGWRRAAWIVDFVRGGRRRAGFVVTGAWAAADGW